jgi:hypothetical protein
LRAERCVKSSATPADGWNIAMLEVSSKKSLRIRYGKSELIRTADSCIAACGAASNDVS